MFALLTGAVGYKSTVRIRANHADSVISIRCSAGHVVTGPPAGVHVTHARGVLLGHEVWCEACASFDSVVAAPERIAMLLEMGAELAPETSDTVLPIVSEQRRIVSMKYLPEVAAIAEELADAADPQELLERP